MLDEVFGVSFKHTPQLLFGVFPIKRFDFTRSIIGLGLP